MYKRDAYWYIRLNHNENLPRCIVVGPYGYFDITCGFPNGHIEGVVLIINKDAYFYHLDRINDYNIYCVIIIGSLEYNDDSGGCQEDFREPNGIVYCYKRDADYFKDTYHITILSDHGCYYNPDFHNKIYGVVRCHIFIIIYPTVFINEPI